MCVSVWEQVQLRRHLLPRSSDVVVGPSSSAKTPRPPTSHRFNFFHQHQQHRHGCCAISTNAGTHAHCFFGFVDLTRTPDNANLPRSPKAVDSDDASWMYTRSRHTVYAMSLGKWRSSCKGGMGCILGVKRIAAKVRIPLRPLAVSFRSYIMVE
jgi:hypothetical protein